MDDGQRQTRMRSLIDTSTYKQEWELKPKSFGFEPNALSTWSHAASLAT